MVQRWLFCNVTDPLNWRNEATQTFYPGWNQSAEEVLYDAEDEEFKAMAEACRDAVVCYLDVSEEIRGEEATFAVRNISHPVFLINFNRRPNMPLVQDERFELLQVTTLNSAQ